MAWPIRVTAQDIRENVLSGSTLLVCAYEDEAKFKTMHLDGAISFGEFRTRRAAIPQEQEIVFYCA